MDKQLVTTKKDKSLSKLEQQAFFALLLDVSDSMSEFVGTGAEAVRKIDSLRLLAERFQLRKFTFSNEGTCRESWDIPEPGGLTDMADAFQVLKSLRVRKIVLITDGLPSNKERALEAASGLQIDIVYVGPAPAPPFLSQLTAATSGSFRSTTLALSDLGELEHTVVGLLEGRVEEEVIKSG